MSIVVAEMVSLLQSALTLANKKAELDEQYFEQFILPTWDSFKKVHEDYKESFQNYMEAISSGNYQVEDILNMIRKDSINTNDLRADLSQMVENLPSASLKTKEEYLKLFCESIINYFYVHRDIIISHPQKRVALPNVVRFGVLIYIQREGKTGQETEEFINHVLIKLQNNYEQVVRSYQKLRTALLS